jgi:hypothetical protein
MTISISNLTVSNNAPAGTVVGILTAYDASGACHTMQLHINKNFRGILCYFREQPGYGASVNFGRNLFGAGSRNRDDHQLQRQRHV